MASFRPTVEAAASPANPDRALCVYYTVQYTKELWWTIAGFTALVAMVQLASYIHTKSAGRKRKVDVVDPERSGTPTSRRLSLRRLPSAIVNAYRIIAFRWTLGFGSYTLNFAEAFLTVAYIVMLFTWNFINSTCPCGIF